MKKTLFLLVWLTSLAPLSLSQDYRFAVPRNLSWVVIDFQGQATVHYRLTFSCQPEGKAIDVVDIGLPNDSYLLESAEATIGGQRLEDIRISEYVKPGVEVHLGERAIGPGDSATLAFSIKLRRLLHRDDRDTQYASFKFSPTWFGSDYVVGATHLECHFVFPPGVSPEEPRYHDIKFTSSWYDSAVGAPVYRWVIENARPDSRYDFGASFPARYVEASSIPRPPGPVAKFFLAIVGAVAAVITFLLATVFFWLPAIFIFTVIRAARNRRLKYMPPVVSIEGAGVRRGLKPPEAAILLEMPLDRVMVLLLFGLVKKGALAVLARQPKLRLRVLDPTQATESYETAFIKAIDKDGSVSLDAMQRLAVDMVNSVREKMRGYSHRDTVKYYKQVVRQSWDEAKMAAGPEERSKVLEENFDWMTMDHDYRTRVRDYYGTGQYYRPRWWPAYYGAGRLPAEAPPPSDNLRVKMPGPALAEALDSDRITLSPGLVGDLGKFTSKVTEVTNPVPVSSGSSGGTGGRSSCACACACAGCACACAGGGR